MEFIELTLSTATSFLNWVLWGNTVQTWFIAIGAALVLMLVLLISRKVIAGRVRALSALTPLRVDRLLADLIDSTQGFYLASISLYAGCLFLYLPPKTAHLVSLIPITALLLQCAWWGNEIIEFFLKMYIDGKKDVETQRVTLSMRGPLKVVFLILLWSVLLLIALENFGVNITTLIAGLGIGGVAVALAVQNILGDLLAALTIIIDKPFVVGDFIILESLMGTVEYIGMKTTRLRNIDGDLLIIPNSDLVKSRIRNAEHMKERRASFHISVSPQTPRAALEKIPPLMQKIINKQKIARFNRANLVKIGASGFDYEIVYHVLKPEYLDYMAIQEHIYLDILEAFQSENIQLAAPV